MPNKQIEQGAAATATRTAPISLMELNDFVTRLEYNIERAECIMQDLTEGYFGSADMSPNSENAWKLYAGYNEHSIKANVVADYLFVLRKLSEEANECNKKLWEAQKRACI